MSGRFVTAVSPVGLVGRFFLIRQTDTGSYRVVKPLRFISEAFKAEVDWKPERNTVIIRSAGQVKML
nr:stalk domain-containing protein [Paenibacillus kribbensis]